LTEPGSGSSFPAPIVPLGASDPPPAPDVPLPSVEPALEAIPEESSSEEETVSSGGPRLLEYLAVFLAAEAVFSLVVVVGAFVGLNEDHRGVGPLTQDPYFSYRGFSAAQFVVLLAELLLLVGSCAVGAWTAFRSSRPGHATESRVLLRARLAMATWLIQAAALPAAILTFAADSSHGQWGAASPVSFWPNVLPGWAWLALDAVGALAICSFCVGLQSRRRNLLPKPNVVGIVGAFLSVLVAVFATLSLSTGLNSATGFWSTAEVSGPSAFGSFSVIEHVSCAQSTCFALAPSPSGDTDSVLRVAGDKVVTTSSIPSPNDDIETMTCASATVCFAYGRRTLLRTDDGGKTFTPADIPGITLATPSETAPNWSLVCSAPDRCYAFTPAMFEISTDVGVHWRVLLDVPSSSKGPTHYISSGACPTLSGCLATGSYRNSPYATYTTDGGLHWQLAAGLPKGVLGVVGNAQCFSPTACYADAGSKRIVTTDGGRSWSTRTPQWKGIAVCSTARDCISAGLDLSSKSEEIAVSVDGGSSWRTAVKLGLGLEASNVSCGADGLCAVGFSSFEGTDKPGIAITTDYGLHWKLLDYS
jgi:hypothetical protein